MFQIFNTIDRSDWLIRGKYNNLRGKSRTYFNAWHVHYRSISANYAVIFLRDQFGSVKTHLA